MWKNKNTYRFVKIVGAVVTGISAITIGSVLLSSKNNSISYERKKVMRKSRLYALLLCLALIVCAVTALTVSAEGETAVAKIGLANIEYGDRMYMSFTVEALEGETLPETVGIAAYADAACSGKPLHVTFEKKVDNGGTEYYASLGIPAREISTSYYYAVVTEVEGEVTVISAVTEYSVAQYVADRADDEGVSAAQKNLYEKIMKYGAAADGVLK